MDQDKLAIVPVTPEEVVAPSSSKDHVGGKSLAQQVLEMSPDSKKKLVEALTGNQDTNVASASEPVLPLPPLPPEIKVPGAMDEWAILRSKYPTPDPRQIHEERSSLSWQPAAESWVREVSFATPGDSKKDTV